MSKFSRKLTQSEIDAMKLIISASEGTGTLPAPIVSDYERNIGIMQDLIHDIETAEFQPAHERIRDRVEAANAPYFSNSNISEFIRSGEKDELIEEATKAFTTVLDTLVIDHKNDPNAMDTPHRLAKMYIKELMSGRYDPMPKITAFPNKHTGKDSGFSGLLVVRAEIKSMCSHHHQIVDGVAYIGIIPKEKVIGLSKYTRLAQWLSRRGTLQEELAEDIAHGIMAVAGSEDVAVYIEGTHGCCENRGINATNSTTQTTVLYGDFMNDATVRKEFHDNVMMQKMGNK